MFDILSKCPAFFTNRELAMFFKEVNEHPSEVITLIALSKSDDVIRFMFENSASFMHGSSAKLLFAFVHSIITEGSTYAELVPAFLSAAFSSGHKRVLEQAYQFLFHHFREDCIPARFTHHLKSPKISPSACLILRKWQSIPIGKRLITALCESAEEPDCFSLLLRCATLPEWAPIIASRAARWNTTPTESVRLMYIMLTHHQLKLDEASILQFCTRIDQSLDLETPPLSALAVILSKLACTESVIGQCESLGLFAKFFNKAISLNTIESSRAGSALVERLSKVSQPESLRIMFDSGKMMRSPLASLLEHQSTECLRTA
jgi:hypothetical protein